MSSRFTEKAQRILLIAQEEAKRLNQDYVGTEHLLLGLITLGEGVAAQVLSNLNIDFRKVRANVEKIIGKGDNVMLLGEIPFTPRAKKVLEFACEEAQNLGHSYVGTEHLLLGLLREEEGVAAQVLTEMRLTLDKLRAETHALMGTAPLDMPKPAFEPSHVELKGTEEVPNTKCDTVFTKEVYLNGKRVGGCKSVSVNVDVTKSLTEVTMTFFIVKDTLRVGNNDISFDLQ